MLKSSVRGVELEEVLSSLFHQEYIPLLVSPLFLRERGAGQVDIAYFFEKRIYLVEVKSSIGCSHRQLKRLRNSGILISSLFDLSVQIVSLKKE